jgi:hypothetical protein
MAHDSAGYVNRAKRDPLIRVDGELSDEPQEIMRAWMAELTSTRERLDRSIVPLVSVDVVPTWVGVYQRTEPTLLRQTQPELLMTTAELAVQRGPTVELEHEILKPGAWLDPAEVLCSDGLCSSLAEDGSARWVDASHLSVRGSRELAEWIWRHLPGVLDRARYEPDEGGTGR